MGDVIGAIRQRCRALVELVVAAVIWLMLVVPAALADCGDDLDGRRVPCACGDVVVVDTRLESTDPVVTESCVADGLAVRARPDAASILLDLNGLALRGQGRGVGIRVVYGGTEGARITGVRSDESGVVSARTATISGFREAVRATRPGSLASVGDLTTDGAERAGIVVRADPRRTPSLEVTPEDVGIVGSRRRQRAKERR